MLPRRWPVPRSPGHGGDRPSWSRKALAAAWLAWPGLPMTRPGSRRGRRDRDRDRRWPGAGAKRPRSSATAPARSSPNVWLVSAASDSTPTLWMTPASGGSFASMRSNIASIAARVGHVCQLDLDDPHARAAHRLDGFRSFGIRVSPAVQHDGAGAAVRQPFGHRASDATQATGDQVGAILSATDPSGRAVLAVTTIFPRCRAARMNPSAGPASARATCCG